MMRGTYQVEFNQKEREREKEQALETNEKLWVKLTSCEIQLTELKHIADLNEYKLKYLLYRIDQACKEIERTKYKSGGSAYRHLQKALWVTGYVVNKDQIPTYEEMREVEKNLLDEVKFGMGDEMDVENPDKNNCDETLEAIERNYDTLHSKADKLTEEAMGHLDVLRTNGKEDVAEALVSFYSLLGTELQILREDLQSVMLLIKNENNAKSDNEKTLTIDDVAESSVAFYTHLGTEIQTLKDEMKLVKESIQRADVVKMPEGAK